MKMLAFGRWPRIVTPAMIFLALWALMSIVHHVSQSGPTGLAVQSKAVVRRKPTVQPLSAAAAKYIKDGQAAFERGEFQEAKELFRKALTESPEDPAVLYYLGLASQSHGDPLSAIAWYRAFLATVPNAKTANDARQQIAEAESTVREQVQTLIATELRIRKNKAIANVPVADQTAKALHSSMFEGNTLHHIVQVLVAVGNISQARQLIAATGTDADDAEKSIILGMAMENVQESLAAAERKCIQEKDIYKVLVLSALCNNQYEEARRLLPRLDPEDSWIIADKIACAGHPDEAMEFLSRTPATHPTAFSNPLDSPWIAGLLPNSSHAVIQKFIETRGARSREDLTTLISAMIQWAYFQEAQEAMSYITDPNWRCVLEVDLLEAKADLKQITRQCQIEELERLSQNTAKHPEASSYIRQSIVFAEIAKGDLATAKRMAAAMKAETDKVHPEIAGPRNYEKKEPNWSAALRAVMEAQSEAGDSSAAKQSADELAGDYHAAAELYLVAVTPVDGAYRSCVKEGKAKPPFWSAVLRKAAETLARKGDTDAATRIATFPCDGVIIKNPWQMNSYAATAAAAYKRGDRKISQQIVDEMLKEIAAKETSLSVPVDITANDWREIAGEFAKAGDAETLRTIAHYVLANSAPHNLKFFGHLLSQLQQVANDADGARQTLETSLHYTPQLEIASWSILADYLEKSAPSFDWVNRFCSTMEQKQQTNVALDMALTVLHQQYDTRSRESCWHRQRESNDNASP
jgi:tetratricopeptide (TPR) repeat protein